MNEGTRHRREYRPVDWPQARNRRGASGVRRVVLVRHRRDCHTRWLTTVWHPDVQ